MVVTDEVYEHLLFDGRAHVPICTLPGMWERTVTISSAGKTFSFTGWKVGWVTGPADLVRTVMAAKQWLTFTNAAPLQPAVAHALTPRGRLLRRRSPPTSRTKRDLLVAGLRELDLDVYTPEATYFVTTDVRALRLPGRDGVLPGAAGARRRGGDPARRSSTTTRRGPAQGALGVLQGDRGASRRASAARQADLHA